MSGEASAAAIRPPRRRARRAHGRRRFIRKALRYVFPDHWSFLFGEIALYSFVVLVGDRAST